MDKTILIIVLLVIGAWALLWYLAPPSDIKSKCPSYCYEVNTSTNVPTSNSNYMSDYDTLYPL